MEFSNQHQQEWQHKLLIVFEFQNLNTEVTTGELSHNQLSNSTCEMEIVADNQFFYRQVTTEF